MVKLDTKPNLSIFVSNVSIAIISVPSKPPRNIQVTAKTSTTIYLSWNATSKEHLNGFLIGYRVNYSHTAKNSYVDTSSSQASVVLKNLGIYTKYLISIAARTVRGPGQFSKPITVITDEDSK